MRTGPFGRDDRPAARVLPFRLPLARKPLECNRMGLRQRMETETWARMASAHGINRVVVHRGATGDDPAEGDFVLIYEAGAEWASWGVAPECGGYAAWRTGTGVTIGRFSTLSEALNAVVPVD